jgi:hypothetical protein
MATGFECLWGAGRRVRIGSGSRGAAAGARPGTGAVAEIPGAGHRSVFGARVGTSGGSFGALSCCAAVMSMLAAESERMPQQGPSRAPADYS